MFVLQPGTLFFLFTVHTTQATVAWGNIYLPPITKRLNEHIPGANLTDNDTHGALYACAYDYAAHATSPWCDAFTSSELGDFEWVTEVPPP